MRFGWVVVSLLGSFMSHTDAEAQGTPHHRLPLELLPDTLAICRLPPGAAIPSWASSSTRFLTVSRTPEELSITVLEKLVPAGTRCERDYRAIRVRGTLPPDLVGVLLSIAEPLARAGLSIFAISTYDTDYVLVKGRDVPAAMETLQKAGHQVTRVRRDPDG